MFQLLPKLHQNNVYGSFFFSSTDLSLVCLSDLVHSHPEDDVLLSCCLDPAISAHSMEIKWWHENRLVCHYEDGQMTGNVDYEGGASLSAEDLHTGNVSLILRSITKSQRGLYRCEVIHRWQTISKHIFLQISCKYYAGFSTYTS